MQVVHDARARVESLTPADALVALVWCSLQVTGHACLVFLTCPLPSLFASLTTLLCCIVLTPLVSQASMCHWPASATSSHANTALVARLLGPCQGMQSTRGHTPYLAHCPRSLVGWRRALFVICSEVALRYILPTLRMLPLILVSSRAEAWCQVGPLVLDLLQHIDNIFKQRYHQTRTCVLRPPCVLRCDAPSVRLQSRIWRDKTRAA